MKFLVIAIVIGLLPANIAKNKGYSFSIWWVYGSLFFILALPQSLVMKDTRRKAGWYPCKDGGFRWWDGDHTWTDWGQRCERCAEMIKLEAKVCRYCGSEVLV